jgi:hypothetical protein
MPNPLTDEALRKSDLLRIQHGEFLSVAKRYSDEAMFALYATAIRWGPQIIGEDKLDRHLVLIRDEISRRSNQATARWARWSAIGAGIAALAALIPFVVKAIKQP